MSDTTAELRNIEARLLGLYRCMDGEDYMQLKDARNKVLDVLSRREASEVQAIKDDALAVWAHLAAGGDLSRVCKRR